jgi:hypothetical protein
MYFVRHQIAYLEAIGDLTTGELTPDDVVDEVLLRASASSTAMSMSTPCTSG